MTALEEIKKAFPNMFRPLKWHHFDGPTEHGCGEWYAHATRGMYHIYDVREKFPNDRPFYAKELSDQFDTLELAKEAYQKRHEGDILLGLEPEFLSTLESLQRENEELREKAALHSADAKTAWAECEALREKVAALEAALSAAEPVAWQPRYKQEVIDHHKSIGSDLCEYAMTVYPTKEQAQGYGYGGHECRALYAEPQPAPFVTVKALEWRDEPIPPSGETLASSVVGLYCIPHSGDRFYLRFRDAVTLGDYSTLDKAKAAAQADYENRIRSAISAQVQDVAVWQSIETAPKDGSTFLAVMAKAYSPRATLCKFQDGKFLSPSQGEKFVLPGWNQWWPTHWMPLPAAPAKQEGGK